jgi:hypothetical protein
MKKTEIDEIVLVVVQPESQRSNNSSRTSSTEKSQTEVSTQMKPSLMVLLSKVVF